MKKTVTLSEVRNIANEERKWCKEKIAVMHRNASEYEKGFMAGLKQIPIMLAHYIRERNSEELSNGTHNR